jgi:hypothetical protein
MAVWQQILDLFSHEAGHKVYARIADDHVEDAHYSVQSLSAGKSYFRLWVAEMFLANDRNWFAEWYPMVHSLVRLQFAGKQQEIAMVAGPGVLEKLGKNNLSKVISLNYPLTTLLPFSGGQVEVIAALVAMKGSDDLQRFIKVMGDFSKLLVVPQLSAVVSFAGPVASGVQELLGGGGGLMVGLHETFVGTGAGVTNELKAGYYAAIDSTDTNLVRQLFVKNGQLYKGTSLANAQGLTGQNYILFRVESRTERDDWEGLTSIAEPRLAALKALAAQKKDEAEAQKRSAIAAALGSDDLTEADKSRVSRLIESEYRQRAKALGLGAVPTDPESFGEAMKRAISVNSALALGVPTVNELVDTR